MYILSTTTIQLKLHINIIMEKKARCIAIVPCPGQGHLIPLVEFAKRFLQHHNEFHVTFLIPTLGCPTPSTKAILNALPPSIGFTFLPQVNVEDLPQIQIPHPVPQMKFTVQLSLPSLHEALSSLCSRTRLVALVLDFFSVDALDLAKQLNLSSYVFFSSGAASVSHALCFSKLDETCSSEFLDFEKTVNIPGCAVPFKVKDLPDPTQFARSSEIYKSYLSACQGVSFADGLILNSFIDLEVETLRALQGKELPNTVTPSVYPVGPIVGQAKPRSDQENNESDECVRWLDNQPSKSVLYISFGSGGTLSHDQLNEIAFGLELSGRKFLWVVRAPNKIANAAYVVGQKEDPLHYLPSGFLDRTKGQGLVVPYWAPQVEVLGHGSTGGFLTHCGWNSTMEGVVHGVPMIAWPLFAEQKMNAILLKDVLKVAVRPKAEENGIVTREEIAKVIKRIMEGDEGMEMRKRIKDLSAAAAVALSENGSSTKALSSLAQKWQNM